VQNAQVALLPNGTVVAILEDEIPDNSGQAAQQGRLWARVQLANGTSGYASTVDPQGVRNIQITPAAASALPPPPAPPVAGYPHIGQVPVFAGYAGSPYGYPYPRAFAPGYPAPYARPFGWAPWAPAQFDIVGAQRRRQQAMYQAAARQAYPRG
jgi:hypothetical protein